MYKCGREWKFQVKLKVHKILIFSYNYYFKSVFIYFWLGWVFIALRGLSVVVASRGYSSLRCAGFLLQWCPSMWTTGSRALSRQLWHTGLVASRHVGYDLPDQGSNLCRLHWQVGS